jgi:hypothetical protein
MFKEEAQCIFTFSAMKVAIKVYLPVRLSGRLLKSPNKALHIFLLLISFKRFNSFGECFKLLKRLSASVGLSRDSISKKF